jgi:hypothetical protein
MKTSVAVPENNWHPGSDPQFCYYGSGYRSFLFIKDLKKCQEIRVTFFQTCIKMIYYLFSNIFFKWAKK